MCKRGDLGQSLPNPVAVTKLACHQLRQSQWAWEEDANDAVAAGGLPTRCNREVDKKAGEWEGAGCCLEARSARQACISHCRSPDTDRLQMRRKARGSAGQRGGKQASKQASTRRVGLTCCRGTGLGGCFVAGGGARVPGKQLPEGKQVEDGRRAAEGRGRAYEGRRPTKGSQVGFFKIHCTSPLPRQWSNY
ncbi:hypothetical protein P154DRAFT_532533 [Amniculicola lignicola CBS 123094]|uniref:Uncharacterized protein n=1 Tax=Amniculicola lignicola CBS 123094 TaxID=1392246 RepID=A0A6A5WQ46_9PLEO|nr:hypothetical protein P154DRAFT_532533 [Amniculicola lignicola CBS 123094]